jgi:hypothetical protein
MSWSESSSLMKEWLPTFRVPYHRTQGICCRSEEYLPPGDPANFWASTLDSTLGVPDLFSRYLPLNFRLLFVWLRSGQFQETCVFPSNGIRSLCIDWSSRAGQLLTGKKKGCAVLLLVSMSAKLRDRYVMLDSRGGRRFRSAFRSSGFDFSAPVGCQSMIILYNFRRWLKAAGAQTWQLKPTTEILHIIHEHQMGSIAHFSRWVGATSVPFCWFVYI